MQRAFSGINRAVASGNRLTALRRAHSLARPCRGVTLHNHFQPALATRALHWTPSRLSSPPSTTSSSLTASSETESSSATIPCLPPPSAEHSPPLETFKIEPRLAITFTCTVEDCGHRSSHEFTKRSYEKGIVIVQCPGCKNRHLIADHMGWFKEVTAEGQHRTIEDIMRAKGETVRRGRVDSTGGVTEFAPE